MERFINILNGVLLLAMLYVSGMVTATWVRLTDLERRIDSHLLLTVADVEQIAETAARDVSTVIGGLIGETQEVSVLLTERVATPTPEVIHETP